LLGDRLSPEYIANIKKHYDKYIKDFKSGIENKYNEMISDLINEKNNMVINDKM